MSVHVHHIILPWHVAALNNFRACGFMLSHSPSDFAGRASQRSVPMHGVEASPCHLHCLGSKHKDVCLHRDVALPELGSPDLGVDILNRKQSPKT